MKKNDDKKSPVSAICSVLGTAILIAVILVCLPLGIPKLIGGQFLSVISGSMEPEIPVGSLVYVTNAKPEKIEVGDVIAFYGARDAGTIITHRVLENHIEDEEFITKGDANETQDMNHTRYDHLVGKVAWHLPKAGFAAQMFSSTSGKLALGCMIGLGLVMHLMADALDKKKK